MISLVGTAIFYFPPSRPHAVAHIPRKQLLLELDYLGGPICMIELLHFADRRRRFLPLHHWFDCPPRRTLPRRQHSCVEAGQRHCPNRLWRGSIHWLFRLGVQWYPQTALVPMVHLCQVPRIHFSHHVSAPNLTVISWS